MEANKTSEFLSKATRCLFGAKWNLRLRYFHHRGHLPSLVKPHDMSEILISQMLDQSYCKSVAQFVDKLAVRDYIKQKGLDYILLNHFGEWDCPEDIQFDDLPSKFVLKSNNGCGHHYFCLDKSKLDREDAIRTLHAAIENGQKNVEPHYHFITPRVYAEELIETEDGSWPIDYKFTCIGGEIVDIFVASERETQNTKYCTLGLDWKPLPYTKPAFLPKNLPSRPEHLGQMIDVAKTISRDFSFVRVDLYEYNGRPYLSELTFFPWGGILYSYTDEAIILYGEKYREALKRDLR